MLAQRPDRAAIADLAPARSAPRAVTDIVRAMANSLLVMGLLIAIGGKIVGFFWICLNEKARVAPFVVLVLVGYAMFIGAGMSGGTFPG